jgi:hypothetical protein
MGETGCGSNVGRVCSCWLGLEAGARWTHARQNLTRTDARLAVTDELQLAHNDRKRYLLEKPQRFGIVPTLWFWNDKETLRLVRWPVAMWLFVLIVVMSALPLHPAVMIPTFMVVYFLGLGSLEKYVRHQALKRRALAESAAADVGDPSGRS